MNNNSGVQIARAALTRLMEPSDMPGLALIRVLGPEDAVAFIRGSDSTHPKVEQEMTEALQDAGTESWSGLADVLGRWRPRLADVSPERDLATLARLGGSLLVPEDPHWPRALDDLELGAPIALWCRGNVRDIPAQERCIAVVGSRDSTSYGANVTGEITHSLVQRHYTVISGGAYGIDANAHRGALSASAEPGVPVTIAVMAGGVDRFYPSGNDELLRTIAERGLVVAEVPPGTNPTRYRFLQRNRLIAALCQVTVVVEARWRSGALNTARHAEMLSRTVGAVPGSVYSANSAGCHRLLREGAAVCVTDAADIAELAGAAGENLRPDQPVEAAIYDGLGTSDLLLLDALPLRTATTLDKLCVVAGLSPATVLSGLGRLESLGLAERVGGGWKRRSQ
ncbi:DNA protecting protein DprA [Arthrobacter sp. PAMC 25486]|uniref:DNA-processing protein DprA n=1 Tax=Arthrobacter sp. PAMC 25486 TaxID=1494608 RepID=UPI000535B790|nr:DNA-processing protein DprA [Arthrobacter sp. PAMC 25486]AIY00756.1 DNA protecting protein DprA [Arthrobacter sp. PAMC 25486]